MKLKKETTEELRQIKVMVKPIFITAIVFVVAEMIFTISVNGSDSFGIVFFIISFAIATVSNLFIRKVAGKSKINKGAFYASTVYNIMLLIFIAFFFQYETGMTNTAALSMWAVGICVVAFTFLQEKVFPKLPAEK